jgi:hypothetical protein
LSFHADSELLNSAELTIMPRAQKRPSTAFDNDEIARPYRESSPQHYKLGARSCRACHQRKIRCDRGVPCTNCSRCGTTCTYPTKDKEVVRHTVTLQSISNRLERLEDLLSRFVEGNHFTTGSAVDTGGGVSQTQMQIRDSVDANVIGTANQHSSNQRPCKSTWQLLLNDEQVFQSTNDSNVEMLLRDVSLISLSLFQTYFPFKSYSLMNNPELI